MAVPDGTPIGDIHIVVEDIFDTSDPKEDRRLFRLANRLHRRTRPRVIASQLLFKAGDPYSQRLVDESERLLRTNRYLHDATIAPLTVDPESADLEVRVRDVWTLNVGGGLGRRGGANSTHFQLQDTNFLGLGKALTFERRSNVDRVSSLFRYDDPAILGTRFTLGLDYSSNSDGSLRKADFGRPFYALDTRWAASFAGLQDDRVETHYALGEKSERFRQQQDFFSLQGGLSSGIERGWARRWMAGFTYQRDRFAREPGAVGPDHLPADRTLSYPWIGLEWIQDDYRVERDLDQIHRTEDLHLGGQLHALLGYSTSALGGDDDRLIFEARASRGFQLTDRKLLLLAGDTASRWGSDGRENASLTAGAKFYARNFGDHLFSATFEGTVTDNLDRERQLTLGGENGLRGYPLRYQDGNARAYLTLEQRFFTDWYPFRLVHVGGAIFFDIGRTWTAGDADDPSLSRNYGILRDVGIGLRLSSSRSGLGRMLHIDLAVPLDGDSSIQSVQVFVTTKQSF
jgi:outer membrane protein assembly factor BamA